MRESSGTERCALQPRYAASPARVYGVRTAPPGAGKSLGAQIVQHLFPQRMQHQKLHPPVQREVFVRHGRHEVLQHCRVGGVQRNARPQQAL